MEEISDERLEKLKTEVDQLLEEERKIRRLRQDKEDEIRLVLALAFATGIPLNAVKPCSSSRK